jgi:hypothetical protein
MDNQKVVVILLLLTIILSIVSVIVTVSLQVSPNTSSKTNIVYQGDPVDTNKASVSLVVQKTGGAG